MSPPDAEEAPDRAPLEAAARQSHDRNNCTDRRLVREASTSMLAASLAVPSSVIDVWFTDSTAPCPSCQRNAIDLSVHEPSAFVTAYGIICFHCLTRTTRWQLEARVLSDPDALERLAASRAVAGAA